MTTPRPDQQSRSDSAAGAPRWAPPSAPPWPPNQQPVNPVVPPAGWPSAPATWPGDPGGPRTTGGVTRPPTRLGLSIVALLCSLVFGAIGLYFSSQVTSRWNAGDVAGAHKASRTALIVDVVGIVLGVLFLLGTA